MLENSQSERKKMPILARVALPLIPILLIIGMLSQYVFARNVYRVTDGARVMMHATYASDPAVVLDELGLELGENDLYTTQPGDGLSEITVQRQQVVTIYRDGGPITATTYGETVESLLSRVLVMGPQDRVSEPLNAKTYDGMVLTLTSAIKKVENYTVPIPYKTVYCNDSTLPLGEEKVIAEGRDGEMRCIADVYYADGKEVSRTVTSQVVIQTAANRVIARGAYIAATTPLPMPTDPPATTPKPTTPKPTTPPSTSKPVTRPTTPSNSGSPVISGNTITTSSGEVLTFTKKLNCVATAYSCDGEVGYTASGTVARVGAIAVDPSFIPLGTRMYIVSNDGQYIYGYAVAEDTGGSIKGNKIDLYFNTSDECWTFGVRDCTVYILG